MKIFNPINREYVNPIDLNVLGRTYNTLEQGHKEAVKAASDLEITMASLDLNENESEWRQNKINEIRQTISDNTNHGNAYGALDDLISKAGNIASDQGMIGRLRAQQDYKAFTDNVDKRGDIPEDYKEYFKEKNPYSYEDKIDNETGKVIGSTKWQPNTTPVATIDQFALMSKALNITAKESGGGANITFLDINGNPTRDPAKSATGEMYMKTSSSFEKLDANKIKSAINAAIESTPGARASLEQDYTIAKWKYDKEAVNEDGTPIVREGITDNNGNILSFDSFLEKRITPFVEASKYNNYRSDVQLGTALQSYKAAQLAKSSGDGTDVDSIPFKGPAVSTNSVGVVEQDVDNYSTTINNKNAANDGVLNILKKYSTDGNIGFENVTQFINSQKEKGKPYGPGIAAANYIKSLEDKGISVSDTDKHNLVMAAKAYVSYNAEQKKIENKVGEVDKANLRFGDSVSREEYKAGNSKWDDDIISRNNVIWSSADKIDIQISPNMVKTLPKYFGVNNISELGFETTTSDNGDIVFSFNERDRNLLPRLASILEKADKDVGASKRAFVRGISKPGGRFSDYDISFYKDGINLGDKLNNTSKGGIFDKPDNNKYNIKNSTTVDLQTLGRIYDKGIEKSAQVQRSAGVQKGIVSIEGTGKSTFKQIELEYMRSIGKLPTVDFNVDSKLAEETVDNMLSTGNFNAGLLWQADENNKFTKVDNANEMQSLVSYMYTNHKDKIVRNAMVPTGVTDSRDGGNLPLKGYTMTFTVPKSEGVDGIKDHAGKTYKIMYGGGLEEGLESDPSISVSNVVHNIYNTSKATNTVASIMDYNNALGSTDVTFDKGVNVNFLGSTIPTSEKGAIEYMKNIYTLDDVKTAVKSGAIRSASDLENSINTLVNNLSVLTNKDPILVEKAIYNFLSND